MTSKNKNIEESFDKFIISSDLRDILSTFNQLCDLVDLNPAENSSLFYKKLQMKLGSYWKAQTLFAKLEKKVSQKDYRSQSACFNMKVLIIGSGPCGLRCAIELALLGARVVVIDKRENFSRNNVLHLWPYVINDLKSLGAKIFFGMFCAGSIDHISIRRLQCILFKVALLFGVQFFVGVTFQSLISPVKIGNPIVSSKGDAEYVSHINEGCGWRAKVIPEDHIISNYSFNTIVGADGKTNILGFPRKELRCRLAIAITANFINNNTSEEAQVEEISGVAFIFNQQFFKDIYNKTGIDLENIVYYKDETHYFVMTAKKHSLLAKGVIKKDYDDPEILLNSNNINNIALQNYAKEAANVATQYKIPNLDFSKNHRGEADVAVFDFTRMFAAENASKIIERNGSMLLQMLVGDSLLEPFWPTGSGCALGFLSSLDAAWLVKRIGTINNVLEQNKMSYYQQKILILEAISERESVYQRLSQTTSSNMPPNFNMYFLDPRTRYSQCKINLVGIPQILHLYDTDDNFKKNLYFTNDNLTISNHDLKNKQTLFTSLNNSYSDISVTKSDVNNSNMKTEYMLRWFQIRLDRYSNFKAFKIDDLGKSWISGVGFLCLIHLYRPHVIDLLSINDKDKLKNLQQAFYLFEREFQIRNIFNSSICIENVDPTIMLTYLDSIYETLRILNPVRLSEEVNKNKSFDNRKMKRRIIPKSLNNIYESFIHNTNSNAKPVRKNSSSRFGFKDIEKGIIENRKEEILRLCMSNYKDYPMIKKILIGPSDSADNIHKNNPFNKQKELRKKENDKYSTKVLEKNKFINQICHFCKSRIYQKKHDHFENYIFHKRCLRCEYCNKEISNQQFKIFQKNNESEGKFYCMRHFHKFQNTSSIREQNNSKTLQDMSEKYMKIKKPRYNIKDYGCPVPHNFISTLPVNQIFDSMISISKTDIEIYLKKNLLNLKRINNESDEEYDGSAEYLSDKGLNGSESIEDNQFSWSLNFNKHDLKYAMNKCQVIQKNRLLYKKYKSKEESTSDEIDTNMFDNDIFVTSDQNDGSAFSDVQNEKSDKIVHDGISTPQQTQDLFDDNIIDLPYVENNTVSNIIDFHNNQESVSEPISDRKKNDEITSQIIDNSRNLRQMAKLRFCTEPPKPVSINSKQFISQINHTKMIVVTIPNYFKIAKYTHCINDVLITVSSRICAAPPTEISSSGKTVISASIILLANYGHYVNNSNEAKCLDKTIISLLDDHLEQESSLIGKSKYNNHQQSLSDIFDIKDIDSMSVNTENSSITRTELNSENELLKVINLPAINRFKQKATLDSELDISLGKSSVEEARLSNDSMNTLSSSSLNSSLKSDINASSESDGRKAEFNDKARVSTDLISYNLDESKKITHGHLKKTFKKHRFKKFQKSLSCTYKMKSSKSLTNNNISQFPEFSSHNSLLCNAVTPPDDIELDDTQVKCLEVNSEYPFILNESISLANIDDISTRLMRLNHINQQLENVEDRLNDLDYSNVKNISNNNKSSDFFFICDKSNCDNISPDESQTYNDKIETDERRISIGMIL